MLEFFEPRSSETGKRFKCTILDRSTAGFLLLPGVKRFRYVMEDYCLGIRCTVEADTIEEARALEKSEWFGTRT